MPPARKGDIGTIARAQDLPHLGGGAFNVAGAADQRHDVTDIDPRIGTQRDFSPHSRQRPQEYAARVVADAFDNVL
jgi:hypothetical protein